MLNITAEVGEHGVRLTLEGELAGSWPDKLEQGWYAIMPRCGSKRVTVVLADSTFVDAEGKRILSWLYEEGANLVGVGRLSEAVVAEVKRKAGSTSLLEGCPEANQRQ